MVYEMCKSYALALDGIDDGERCIAIGHVAWVCMSVEHSSTSAGSHVYVGGRY